MDINNAKDLDDAIGMLKTKQKNDAASLKNNFNDLVESLKPKNLIKSAFKNATEGSSAGGLLLKAAAGIGGSLLNNNVKVGKGSSIIGIATNTLKSGMAGTVLKNADKIIAWGTAIFNSFSKKNTVSDRNKRIENVVEKNVKYINAIDEKMTATSGLNTESALQNINNVPVISTTQTDAERGYKEGLFNNSDTEKK
jgi:formylmethanofuran dehydrogenase subunit B